MALGDDFERRDFSANAVATTLNGAMGGTGAVTPSLSDATGWPTGSDGPFYALFNGVEIVEVTSRSSTTLTIASGGRGKHGTSAANHASGSSVVHIATLPDFDEANRIVNILGNGTSGLPLLGGGTATVPGYAKVDSGGIADGSIDLVHMSANSVDSDQYVDGSIDRVHLAADIVDGTKIADDAVNSEHIAAGAVDLEHMSANSVDSDQYVDGSIDSAHIGNDQIDSQHYAAGSIDVEHLASGTVPIPVAWFVSGNLTTQTGAAFFRAPVAYTIKHVRLYAGTAPTGANLIVDVNKNGTTVFTTQGNRPTMTDGQQDEDATTAPDVTAVAAGDRLSVDIDQIGSSVAGANLSVIVYLVPA